MAMSIHVHSYPNNHITQMVTTTREDLFAISRILAQAINPQVLFDKEHPLTISINGMFDTGKSIIPLEMRNHLFKDAQRQEMLGRKGYDEYHEAQINGQKLQLNIIDPLWRYGYGHPAIMQGQPGLVEYSFKKVRTEAGIDFIINSGSNNNPDLEIWIEDNENQSNNHESGRKKHSVLYEHFFTARREHINNSGYRARDWTRFIEVQSLTPAFHQAVQDLHQLEQLDQDTKPTEAADPINKISLKP